VPPGPATTPAERALALLDRVRASMDAGEDRPGQREMVGAIAGAIARRRHVVVQAGTGTGKSLGYLVPALSMGRRTVVATATKALQDQLAGKELPMLAEHLDRPISWAVLKGRSNYLCLQRLDEADGEAQLDLGGAEEPTSSRGAVPERRLRELRAWAATTDTGDRADLPEEPPGWVWQAVSVGPRECPGAAKCPRGEDCFAEAARKRAGAADVVVVNTHLYGLHLAANRMVLPDHDVVVFDEAHEVEDIVSATTGMELGPGSFTNLARLAGGVIADDVLGEHLDDDARRLADGLRPHHGSRLRRGLPDDVAELLGRGREHALAVTNALRSIDSKSPDVATRVARVNTAVIALVADIDAAVSPPDDSVMWVGGTEDQPRIELAPLDVGRTLDELLWNPEPLGLEIVAGPADAANGDVIRAGDEGHDGGGDRDGDDRDDRFGLPDTVVFTSATVPPGLAERLRIPPDDVEVLDVGTPFDFEHHALLYCATHLPDPRSERWATESVDELERLIRAAGGRTLALFTSHRAMEAAADELETRLPVEVLRQGQKPKPALVEAFATDETSCLFATMGFWAGIDVPGPALSLVTIDKIPFPRPDEPLGQARRERAGAAGFTTIDLPRAATLLAQGAGRLIRTATDRGVVAVLDPRLATKASYRWQLIGALPPMKRTKDLAEVERFFAEALGSEPDVEPDA